MAVPIQNSEIVSLYQMSKCIAGEMISCIDICSLSNPFKLFGFLKISSYFCKKVLPASELQKYSNRKLSRMKVCI